MEVFVHPSMPIINVPAQMVTTERIVNLVVMIVILILVLMVAYVGSSKVVVTDVNVREVRKE